MVSRDTGSGAKREFIFLDHDFFPNFDLGVCWNKTGFSRNYRNTTPPANLFPFKYVNLDEIPGLPT